MQTTTYPERFTRSDLKIDPPELRDRKIEALIKAMTMEEKFSLLGGSTEPEDKGKIGNAGYQWGVPRLGVPEAVMYDGPAGITGVVETTGLPQPSLLGCTWDPEMAYEFGAIAASEAAACSGNYLLAPQVDVIRTPHFMRNKDMKAEDSYLAGVLGVEETKGCQDQGVIATIKHFAVANTMGRSFFNFPNEMVDEQTLHEQYLRTFEMSIREGNAGSLMNAYNKVNGDYMSANAPLLKGVLRDQWGYKGSVMSDWGSVHAFTMNKGMDMEMPFPAYNNANRILKRIRNGEMSWEDLDDAVRHVLYGMATVGLLGLVQLDEEGKVIPEPLRKQPIQMEWYYEEAVQEGLFDQNAEKAAKIVEEGAVLLKNDGVLPLQEEQLSGKVALLGLGAKYPVTGQMQERSYGTIRRMQSGQEALLEVTGREFAAYPGIDYVGEPIPAECFFRNAEGDEKGLVRTFGILPEDRDPVALEQGPGGAGAAFTGFTAFDEDGVLIDTGMTSYNAKEEEIPADFPLGKQAAIDPMIDFTVGKDSDGKVIKTYKNGPNGTAFLEGESFTWKGYLEAPESGEFRLILECIGGMASFFIRSDEGWKLGGKSAMREWAQWPWESLICTPEGMGITGTTLKLTAGKRYEILVHARGCVKNKDLQLRLAWQTPSFMKKNYDAALSAAKDADTIIFYACENVMRDINAGFRMVNETMPLTMGGEERQFLADVIAAKRPEAKLVVIVQSSNARAIGDWEGSASAILTAYHPGQEGARILAKILIGAINPSGKLSQSWPARTEDTPITDSEEHLRDRGTGDGPDQDIRIRMTEGIFTGYRYYDKTGVKALYPFGYGLSYTSFEYSGLEVETVDGVPDFGSTIRVSFTVKNTGERAGSEIAQIYIGKGEVPPHMQCAEKQLIGFIRVKDLAPGEEKAVSVTIDPRMLLSWDPALTPIRRSDGTLDKWVRPDGPREVMVAASSTDIRLCTTV
ncbi:MAG: glycoside hydrolase family 3 C-terminal domain-containing protein [Lachnospiraceae bacterium]|nr:glycoside hydrolase family 3 C-terminal domain-containing protein [Lachnospiraceae bacterium]